MTEDRKDNGNLTYFEKRELLAKLAKHSLAICFYARCRDFGIIDEDDLKSTGISIYVSKFREGARLYDEYGSKHPAKKKRVRSSPNGLEQEVEVAEEVEDLKDPFEIATREAREILETEGYLAFYRYLKDKKSLFEAEDLAGTYFSYFFSDFLRGKKEYDARERESIATLAREVVLHLRIPPVQDSREHVSDREYKNRLSILREREELKDLDIEVKGYSHLKGKELAEYFYGLFSQIKNRCKSKNPEAYKKIMQEANERFRYG